MGPCPGKKAFASPKEAAVPLFPMWASAVLARFPLGHRVSLRRKKEGVWEGFSRPFLASVPAFLPGQQESGSEQSTKVGDDPVFFTHTDTDTVFLMHELGVTQNILQIALEHAQKAGAKKIHRIHLVIGGLSGVVHESVQFYFDFVSKDTPAEGAQLVFKRVPARFRCRKCAEEFEFQGENWNCPACLAPGPDIISGREFYLESLEVE